MLISLLSKNHSKIISLYTHYTIRTPVILVNVPLLTFIIRKIKSILYCGNEKSLANAYSYRRKRDSGSRADMSVEDSHVQIHLKERKQLDISKYGSLCKFSRSKTLSLFGLTLHYFFFFFHYLLFLILHDF